MPVNASLNRFPIDAQTILRAKGLATVTADTGSTALVLDRDDSYWGYGIAQDLEMAIVVEVESIDTTTGDETYNFIVQVDNSASFGSPTTVVSKAMTAVGRYVFVVPREAIVSADSAATHLRVLVDVGGTTPIIGWNAYVAPVVGS